MVSNPASPLAQPAATGPRLGFSDALHAIARLFAITRPEAHTQTTHLWWLAAFTFAGAWVRFWGLGSVGLHGDEETMAMAVRHILIDGSPILPSGMFYPRGLTQLYLMALSVAAFGESEWAFRIPSAACGTVLIVVSYALGRRFLRPQWSLALAAAVAFLPELIIYSQTARMYIFLVTCVAASMLCLFRWERTERIGWLIGAVALLILGMDMQLLAAGAILIFLLPGLMHGDLRKLSRGATAAAVCAVAFVLIESWTSAQYPVPPPEFAPDAGPLPWERSWAPPAFALTFDIALGICGIAIGFFAVQLGRAVTHRAAAWASVALLLAGLILQLALCYHLAGLAYLVGIVLAWRYRSAALRVRLLTFVIAVGIVTLIHVTLLASTPGSIIKLVGAMVGQPSVWPYVRVAQLSEGAGVLTAALLAWGLYEYTQHRPIADYWLLALLGVFAPVFVLGVFAWNAPPRYTAMAFVPLLVCAFAFAQHGSDWMLARLRDPAVRRKAGWLIAPLVSILVVNPVAAANVINAGYQIHPDHKGAAEFMRSVGMTDDDVVLAEDVLQQTYYLGKVDYWLIGPQVARRFIKSTDEGVVDFYTGTPVVVSEAMLEQVLRQNVGKRIFIIGSGEDQKNKRRYARGEELYNVLHSDRFEVIHTGRDGLTQILRPVPERAPGSPLGNRGARIERAQEAVDDARLNASDAARAYTE